MDCIAHRGFAAKYPENTLPAVQTAARTADAVEVDVRRCASGELVLCHDETVDRVTNGTGPVADHTADELEALSVYGTDVGIPTFAEALAVMPPESTLHAELKEAGLARDLADIAAAGACDVVVSSFDADVLAAVPDHLARAYLFTGRADEPLATAQEHNCIAVHPHKYACTPEFVEDAQDAGLRVHPWTIEEPRESRDLERVGVDGVIVDSPDCCPSALDEE